MDAVVISWPLVACFVVGFFTISGLVRGWWKEAVTTIVLGFFIFLLLNPDWAEAFINFINWMIATVWRLIPDSIISIFNDILETLFGESIGGGPLQLDASSAQTWLLIMGVSVGLSILVGRVGLGEYPSVIGRLLGAIVGVVNGLLLLSLTREYLDGRALPGSEAAVSEIPVVSSNAYGPAATQLLVGITDLPGFTILDSVIPWIVVGIGLLFLFSIFRSRVAIDSSEEGRRVRAKTPAFYIPPPKPRRDKGPEIPAALRGLFPGQQQ